MPMLDDISPEAAGGIRAEIRSIEDDLVELAGEALDMPSPLIRWWHLQRDIKRKRVVIEVLKDLLDAIPPTGDEEGAPSCR
jgi:hypothetical protein